MQSAEVPSGPCQSLEDDVRDLRAKEATVTAALNTAPPSGQRTDAAPTVGPQSLLCYTVLRCADTQGTVGVWIPSGLMALRVLAAVLEPLLGRVWGPHRRLMLASDMAGACVLPA